MPEFKKGDKVTVWMGFTTEGEYVKQVGEDHFVFVDDPMCGEGIFGFEKWDEQNNRFTV